MRYSCSTAVSDFSVTSWQRKHNWSSWKRGMFMVWYFVGLLYPIYSKYPTETSGCLLDDNYWLQLVKAAFKHVDSLSIDFQFLLWWEVDFLPFTVSYAAHKKWYMSTITWRSLFLQCRNLYQEVRGPLKKCWSASHFNLKMER